jgi:hypothetical protein
LKRPKCRPVALSASLWRLHRANELLANVVTCRWYATSIAPLPSFFATTPSPSSFAFKRLSIFHQVTMHSALLLSTLLAFSLSSVAQQLKCEIGYPFFVNASDSTTRVNQFQPPFGPLHNESVKWNWTLATACYNIEGSQGAVEQRLWLDTQPTLNLLSDDLGVIGCGVVAHGLTYDTLKKGQNDNGTCSSMLSQTCIRSILNATSEAAHGTTTAGSSASEICSNFENLQQNQLTGLPSECSASFAKGAWLQSFGRVLINHISVRGSTTNTKQRYSLCIPSS